MADIVTEHPDNMLRSAALSQARPTEPPVVLRLRLLLRALMTGRADVVEAWRLESGRSLRATQTRARVRMPPYRGPMRRDDLLVGIKAAAGHRRSGMSRVLGVGTTVQCGQPTPDVVHPLTFGFFPSNISSILSFPQHSFPYHYFLISLAEMTPAYRRTPVGALSMARTGNLLGMGPQRHGVTVIGDDTQCGPELFKRVNIEWQRKNPTQRPGCVDMGGQMRRDPVLARLSKEGRPGWGFLGRVVLESCDFRRGDTLQVLRAGMAGWTTRTTLALQGGFYQHGTIKERKQSGEGNALAPFFTLKSTARGHRIERNAV